MERGTNPTRELEQALWSEGLARVAGVDEVGRGCLAGPVVAAACILPPGCGDIPGVRDSKLLTSKQRARVLTDIRQQALAIGLGAASRREIDRLNIRRASVLAMRRALARLGQWDYALCDGLLPPELDPVCCRGVVHGDGLSLSIACASVVAKEARDALMRRLAARHPDFGWEQNAGYGTAQHLDALARLGPTPHHRTSFEPVRLALETGT
ncbi:MAG TPA: ribonuclease HII [Nitrolancea sp.]|nr:ribonuclease HII [Nitrolancea sp.]